MNPVLNEWLELAIRWTHVFAGIMWVGATYYFTWLDGRFVELEERAKQNPNDPNPEKFVWMVHSGGFYLVEKQKNPTMLNKTLHWFKWESGITWITGILLFGLVYWHGHLLTDMESTATDRLQAICPQLAGMAALAPLLNFVTAHPFVISGLMILVSWMVYDFLCYNLLKKGMGSVVIAYILLVIAAIACCVCFPGRAAYMQLAAMMGTMMAANVWMRIIPPQRRMVAALKAGQPANLAEGENAKNRSKHNTFIVLPVVFIMLSNHYPGTYGSKYNWAILSAMILVGWFAAKLIRKA